MPRDQALKLVETCWIFCQHSVTASDGDQEFGSSPAEAALLEKPVVSTLHNGLPEHIIHGTTGLLTREWDIAGMAESMMKLANNAELRMRMGKEEAARTFQLCSSSNRSRDIGALIDLIRFQNEGVDCHPPYSIALTSSPRHGQRSESIAF